MHFNLTVQRCVWLRGFKFKKGALKYGLTLFFAFLFSHTVLFAQQTITGKVIDEKSNPLVGATIRVSGSRTAVPTGPDGSFSITASKGQVLEISYVGKAGEKVTVGDN